MDNLSDTFNAIVPMFLIIGVGILCRRLGLVPESNVGMLHDLVFRVFTPVLLFNNIYSATSGEGGVALNPKPLSDSGVAIVGRFGRVVGVNVALFKDKSRRGALIHGIFRSN